jgi:hypothetical protein
MEEYGAARRVLDGAERLGFPIRDQPLQFVFLVETHGGGDRKPLYYDDDTLCADVNGPWMPEEE